LKHTSFIALRHLFSNNNNFQRYTSIISLSGIAIGVCALIIVSSISSGFSGEIETKLSNIDGSLRIQSFVGNINHINEFNKIYNKLIDIESIDHIAAYIETHALVKYGSKHEGVIAIGINNTSVNKIFKLNKYTNLNINALNKNSIFIGNELSDILDINISDRLIIFNFNQFNNDQLIKASNSTVTNIFKTNFSEYDKKLVFLNIDYLREIFLKDEYCTGILLNIRPNANINKVKNEIIEKIGTSHYYVTTWEDRHYSLIQWLKVYDVPIKIVMFFIILIAIFNNTASLWILIVEKSKNMGILRSLGLSKNNIASIIFKEGLIIGIIGSFFGCLLSFLIIITQNYFNIIKLQPEIYFMETIIFKSHPYDFFKYSISAIFLCALFTIIPVIKMLSYSTINLLKDK